MEFKTNTVRETNVTLTNVEFVDAIRMYLKSKGVQDTDQHVVVKVEETRGDEGDLLHVTIKNYNKDYDIHKKIELPK